jgi:ubiquitin C-terminal hydrolase
MLDLPPPTYKPPTSDARVHSYNSARYYETKSEALPGSPPPASGLSNESMCCFLNSLIQALFYTPDFRSAVYTYADRSESPIVKNIAKLFATLQKTER